VTVQISADGVADFTRGGGPYACLRIGLASACPQEPDEGRREGSLVKSAAARTAFLVSSGPDSPCPSRQPTGTRRRRSGSVSGAAACAPCRRRGRPLGAALKPYRKFSHAGEPHRGVSRTGSDRSGRSRRPLQPQRCFASRCAGRACGASVALQPQTLEQ
jgi:hypothetical protein